MTSAQTGITMTDSEFRRITAIAASEAGLAIPDTKKSLVQSRVARRMRTVGIDGCAAYLDSLSHDAKETEHLISALTTNVSHFFREAHHFDHIREFVQKQPKSARLRFWSAGCSNGQEPYSLAMEIHRTLPDAASRDILILATDIDRTVLEKAKTGLYTESEIEGVSAADRTAFLTKQSDGNYLVKEALRQMVKFRPLNLNAPQWPMKGLFDAVLCRNVVIYFDDDTQAGLWPRFRARIKPGGTLMLGHSERIHPLSDSGFEAAGVTTYRRL